MQATQTFSAKKHSELRKAASNRTKQQASKRTTGQSGSSRDKWCTTAEGSVYL